MGSFKVHDGQIDYKQITNFLERCYLNTFLVDLLHLLKNTFGRNVFPLTLNSNPKAQ